MLVQGGAFHLHSSMGRHVERLLTYTVGLPELCEDGHQAWASVRDGKQSAAALAAAAGNDATCQRVQAKLSALAGARQPVLVRVFCESAQRS